LNSLADVDFVEVMKVKLGILKEIYKDITDDFFESEDYLDFFKHNKHWLSPYAAFCYLRDEFGTSDFGQWATHSVYNKKEIEKLTTKNSAVYKEIAFHYFVQYHLHDQLKAAADYVHKKGVVLKGDIAIGVYRYGCDTWVDPELYHMDWQAGAPPDDFAVKGQNWGFPTYNWKKMQKDHFDWWRKRFEQMSNYFDAFRIDHILGFFRIWSIPDHAIEGIMGHFVPAIPVSITEFGERGIWFDYHRYCKPFITDEVLNEVFGELAAKVKAELVIPNDFSSYDLEFTFETQRQVEEYFLHQEPNEENRKLKQGLLDLISNVILIEDDSADSQGQKFHFRIAVDSTSSFRYLDWQTQQKLKDLYVDYFYRRQDDFWMKEAMHKLPYLKRATNMLICGEDLGMVPHCVPDVMKQLGILSLEIQRMPKKTGADFFHPKDASYLSVITPSTHDMSTIRGWWEEDKTKIATYFNYIMGQWGDPPYYCEPWINRAIVLQHFYSPAMWSIFQLQDLLGMSETLRRENPHEERINVPADPNNKWKYRMHISLEDLLQQKGFNDELHNYVEHSGR
jgi:4-alpha-glucanotransferase